MAEQNPSDESHKKNPGDFELKDNIWLFITLLAVTTLLLGAWVGYTFGLEQGRGELADEEIRYLLGSDLQSQRDELYLRNIIPGGPAYLAGINEGARIIAIGSQINPDRVSFLSEVNRYQVGEVIRITSETGYRVQQHSLVLGIYATSPYPLPVVTLPPLPPIDQQQGMDARLGVYYRMLTADDAFGVGEGALIITAGRPLSDAGGRIGDIITEIDGIAITERMPLNTILDQYEAGDRVELRVYRTGEWVRFLLRLADN